MHGRSAWKESDLELDALLSRFLPRQPAGRRPSDALGSVQKAGDVAMAVAAVLDSLARIRDLWGVSGRRMARWKVAERHAPHRARSRSPAAGKGAREPVYGDDNLKSRMSYGGGVV